MEYFKELKDIITNNYCELIYLNYCLIFTNYIIQIEN